MAGPKLKLSAKARSQRREVFSLIGEGISLWQSVEDVLAELFAVTVKGDSWICLAAYHAVISFEARLSMVDAVVSLRMDGDEEELARWRTLGNRLAKKARKRAEIAHSRVVTVTEPDNVSITRAYPFYAWSKLDFTPVHEMKGLPLAKGAIALGVAELKDRNETFALLHSEVRHFTNIMKAYVRQPPRPRSSKPSRREPTLHAPGVVKNRQPRLNHLGRDLNFPCLFSAGLSGIDSHFRSYFVKYIIGNKFFAVALDSFRSLWNL